MRHRFVKIAILGLTLALGGAIVLAARSGLLRQAYFAAATEFALMRHGDRPVRELLSWNDHENRMYIAAGEFTMGDGTDKRKFMAHRVYLDAYWIDQFEVTNSMLADCVRAGACQVPSVYDIYYDVPQYEDYPAVYVTWWAAQAYCGVEGGRLPTEAEWEKAARGTDERPYPWGKADPDNLLLNFNLAHSGLTSSYNYLQGMSPYGLLNMAGNVREWVFDWYAHDYYLHSPYMNPQGPATGTEKSLRGGSYSDNAPEVQVFHRTNHDPNSAGLNRGFRCAFDATK
jgi:formylglycine-generating enzyme required for sulfatase activity